VFPLNFPYDTHQKTWFLFNQFSSVVPCSLHGMPHTINMKNSSELSSMQLPSHPELLFQHGTWAAGRRQAWGLA
jgi:hypothetical protein